MPFSPFFSRHVRAYLEQLGSNLHEGGNRGDMAYLYSFMRAFNRKVIKCCSLEMIELALFC